MKITAISKSGIYKQLHNFYMEAHNSGDEVMANKLYKLSEDVMFDDYLSIQNIKAKFVSIINSMPEDTIGEGKVFLS